MVVSVFLFFYFWCFKSDVLKTIIFFISSFCLFVKTNRGRFMLCLSFNFLQNSLYEWNLIGFCYYIVCVFCSDIMLWSSVFISVLTKYQKLYALLKTVSYTNCFRFNQIKHKHQGFVFIKYGEIVEPSGVQALKNPKPFEGCWRLGCACSCWAVLDRIWGRLCF